MKSKLLILLISITTIVNAETTYQYLDHTFTISGFVNYTYNSEDIIASDGEYAAVNLTIANDYGYISSQVATNHHNPLRRLFLDIPLYNIDGFNSELMIGRLNNQVGFINTVIINSYSNQAILLPLSTYDPRRYNNLPDIADGGEIKITKIINNNTLKLYAWGGKPVMDDPVIGIYRANFKIFTELDYMYGFKVKWYNDDYAIEYAHTYSTGFIERTSPSIFIKYIDQNTFQRLQFLSFSYTIDKVRLQSETAYKEINASTNTIGTYLNISYNFIDSWNAYIGYSYGKRIKSDANVHDALVGLSTKFGNIDLGLEYHYINGYDWNFTFNQPVQTTYNVLLVSVNYNF